MLFVFRCQSLLWQHWNDDWLQAKSVHEDLLAVHHPSLYTGEYHTDTRRYSGGRWWMGWSECIFMLGFSLCRWCLHYVSTVIQSWPIIVCTHTHGGPLSWAGCWLAALSSGYQWWWSSSSSWLQAHLSRFVASDDVRSAHCQAKLFSRCWKRCCCPAPRSSVYSVRALLESGMDWHLVATKDAVPNFNHSFLCASSKVTNSLLGVQQTVEVPSLRGQGFPHHIFLDWEIC